MDNYKKYYYKSIINQFIYSRTLLISYYNCLLYFSDFSYKFLNFWQFFFKWENTKWGSMKIGHMINYLFHYIEYIRNYKYSLNNIVTFSFINIFINIYIIYNFINNKKIFIIYHY